MSQGLAYALLANMPPQYGLYTSLMPPFIYMLMGSCSQTSFGVTAIEALFVSLLRFLKFFPPTACLSHGSDGAWKA